MQLHLNILFGKNLNYRHGNAYLKIVIICNFDNFNITIRKMYEEPYNSVLMKNKNVTTISYKKKKTKQF